MSKMTQITGGRRFWYALLELLKPSNWFDEFKYDHQRKQRGWSDRDTWQTGDYLLEVTSGMLKKLGDEKSHIDWDAYFVTNYPNNLGYKSLEEVAKDIDAYLEFDEYSWGDNLGFEIKHGSEPQSDGTSLMTSLNTPEEEKKIKEAIENNRREYDRVFKKANKAMQFVSYNFPALWD